MAVYVDDMYKYATGQFGRMKMSHMIADSSEELIKMAKKIGVNTKWIQYEGTAMEHFDIALSKRKLAVENGAKEITWMELGRMSVKRKQEEKRMIEEFKKDKDLKHMSDKNIKKVVEVYYRLKRKHKDLL